MSNPGPKDSLVLSVAELLELVEVVIEIQQHHDLDREYWEGFKDCICVLIAHTVGKKPAITDPAKIALLQEWLDLATVDKLERELHGDDPYSGYDC